MCGDRFSSSTTCSGWRHETEPGRLDQSLSCRFWKVATHPCGFGHTNDARYSVEDLLNLKLQRSGADGVPLPGLDPVRATVFRTRPRVCEVFMLSPRIQRDEREPGVRRERASRSNQEPPAELVAEPRVRGFDGFDTLFQTRQGWAVIVHRCSGASGAERIACSCSSLLFIPHRSRN